MDFETILEALKVLGVVVVLSGLLYSYYRFEGVRKAFKKVLPFLPHIFAFLGSRAEDKKGVFDQHDLWVLLGRVTDRIKETIQDPANKEFADVEDEVFEIVSDELARYRNAGVSGIPDLDDPAIKVQVKVVFEAIQSALREDSTGSDS